VTSPFVRWPLFIAAIVALAVVGTAMAELQRPIEPSIEGYCRAMTGAEGLDESLASFDPTALEPQVAALRKASKVAPPEIAPQVATLLQLTSVLQATIDTARTDQARALEATLRDHAGELDAVSAAGRAVETYTRTHCAIELNADSIPTAAGP
jgi:hypothetical protein